MMPLSLADKLQLLIEEGQMQASKLKHPIVTELVQEGIITDVRSGRTKSTLVLSNATALHNYLFNKCGITDLKDYILTLKNADALRADIIEVSSNSKSVSRRTFKGFLISSYLPIECTLNGQPFLVHPDEGTFQFVSNYEQFIPAHDVVIVGVENAELFTHISRVSDLFNEMKPLFICRYPQEQSKDVMKWLQLMPNRYLHFGDFDFAGINIYMQEYKKHLGERASFLIPDGIEVLFEKHGNRKLYDGQHLNDNLIDESAVKELISKIHKHKKGLEQEALLIGH